jgi:O-acetylserine/cysteine efflux transporter
LPSAAHSSDRERRFLYLGTAFALFLVWSNSFVAASYLLGGERPAAQFDWLGLSAARFSTLVPLCLVYALVFRRRQCLALLRRFPIRLPLSGLLAVPVYNLSLYYGQQHGVPPPVAALTSALTPLLLLVFAAVALGERLTKRKIAAFVIALAGLFTIALSRGGFDGLPTFGLLLAITAIAPVSWSIYTVLSKAVVGTQQLSQLRVATQTEEPNTRGRATEESAADSGAAGVAAGSPLDWTYLTMGIGSLPLLLLLPFHGGRELLALSPGGWFALFHLSVLSAFVGYAVWSWLLRHLPASTVAFFVFLNPPLTLLSKLLLSLALPSLFVFHLNPLELVGSALALAGLAFAIAPGRDARPARAAAAR